jgi:uncharacterized membrane protein
MGRMTIRLRQLALKLRASYWFLPALLTVGAILVALLAGWVDRTHGDALSPWLAWLATDTPDGARQLLSSISTGMVSVAGTVFAITIAAVVYASGTYGPRLLFNFMTDRGNQLALGVFIATYLYCLLVLSRVEGVVGPDGVSATHVPQLSLANGFALALLSVAVLVYFLHHVPASIRINSVLSTIGRQLIAAVERRYPEAGEVEPIALEPHDGQEIASRSVGYVELVDWGALGGLAEAKQARIFLACRTGDFLQPGMILARIEGWLEGEEEERLRGAFGFGSQRTAEQDIEYLIDELVEIALRALSPSMNDPFTAITSLFWLGAVTGELARRNLDRDPDGKPAGARGVYPVADDFEHFLRRGFGSVMPSAATHPMVAGLFVETLTQVALHGCGRLRAAAIGREIERLRDQSRIHLAGPVLAALEETVKDVQARLAQRRP